MGGKVEGKEGRREGSDREAVVVVSRLGECQVLWEISNRV